jgi:hypothetical protein
MGGHVDHRLTRMAAERLNRTFMYYEDVPYVILGATLPTEFEIPSAGSKVFSLDERDIRAWIGASLHYRSQISTFWKSDDALMEDFLDYHASKQGIHLHF